MTDYSKALSFNEKSLESREKILPANHPDLAVFYRKISMVYFDVGEYSQAFSFYHRALKIFQTVLPSNDPNIKDIQRFVEYLKKLM